MTTQINVTVTGNDIVGKSKQDQEANRDSLQRREDEAVTIKGAKRGIVTVNGQQVAAAGQLKSRRAGFAREKPAAYRSGRRRFGNIAWVVEYSEDPWIVYSGNYETYITMPSAYFQDNTVRISAFAMPAGNGNAIAAAVASILYPGTGYEIYSMRCFVASERSVRQINAPQTLINCWQTDPFFAGEDFTGTGYAETWFESAYTPRVFEVLNAKSEFIDSSIIKQFPANKNLITRDYRFGFFADDAVDRSLYFAEWLGEEGDVDFTRSDLLIRKPDQTIVRPPSSATQSELYPAYPRSIWDWDDPAYCRTMLNALGFTDADLTP